MMIENYLSYYVLRVRKQDYLGRLLSEKLSKDLKKYGFTFVGPVICYAFMQASGMVSDHEKSCFKSK